PHGARHRLGGSAGRDPLRAHHQPHRALQDPQEGQPFAPWTPEAGLPTPEPARPPARRRPGALRGPHRDLGPTRQFEVRPNERILATLEVARGRDGSAARRLQRAKDPRHSHEGRKKGSSFQPVTSGEDSGPTEIRSARSEPSGNTSLGDKRKTNPKCSISNANPSTGAAASSRSKPAASRGRPTARCWPPTAKPSCSPRSWPRRRRGPASTSSP